MKVMFFAKILDIYTNDHKSFLSKLMFGVKVEYSVLHACCLARRKKMVLWYPKITTLEKQHIKIAIFSF